MSLHMINLEQNINYLHIYKKHKERNHDKNEEEKGCFLFVTHRSCSRAVECLHYFITIKAIPCGLCITKKVTKEPQNEM